MDRQHNILYTIYGNGTKVSGWLDCYTRDESLRLYRKYWDMFDSQLTFGIIDAFSIRIETKLPDGETHTLISGSDCTDDFNRW